MPRFTPFTKRKYNLFEVASCLQKAIRRGNTSLAGYMAIEMFESNYALYCWKRLLTISAEDVAGIVTQEIKALYDSWLVLTDSGKKQKSRIFISKAVIVLCQARKCRDADVLTNYVYDRQMVDARELEKAIEEARENPENIELPDYTFDCHTARGKRQGKTKEQFFLEEHRALQPREQGTFDALIEPTNNDDN
jgi:replication-associated recombination protein RarA